MGETFTLTEIDALAQIVRDRIPEPPKVAMILGSGLGTLAEAVEDWLLFSIAKGLPMPSLGQVTITLPERVPA